MGEGVTRGIMNDWALWLAQNAPSLNIWRPLYRWWWAD